MQFSCSNRPANLFRPANWFGPAILFRPAMVAVLIVASQSASGLDVFAATLVRFDTTKGIIDFQLFDEQMPTSTANFLSYVTTDRYDGSFVHLSTPDEAEVSVIQGGGFYFADGVGLSLVPPDPPIADEPGGGVAGPSNVRGTISFAKRGQDR